MSTMRVPLTVAVVVACACSGCRSGPPGPKPSVNATVDSHLAIYYDVIPERGSEVVVVARCRSCEEFNKTRHGSWNHHWFVVGFDVIDVEQGTWSESTVSFICFDAWPTPESGIMLGKAAWPYRPGVKMRLWLDTKRSPARVVGQQLLFDPFRTSASHPH